MRYETSLWYRFRDEPNVAAAQAWPLRTRPLHSPPGPTCTWGLGARDLTAHALSKLELSVASAGGDWQSRKLPLAHLSRSGNPPSQGLVFLIFPSPECDTSGSRWAPARPLGAGAIGKFRDRMRGWEKSRRRRQIARGKKREKGARTLRNAMGNIETWEYLNTCNEERGQEVD